MVWRFFMATSYFSPLPEYDSTELVEVRERGAE